MIKNTELELALNFIEKTDRNVFLTGKAGTGKTTFLHKIKSQSLKRMVVVAPTGVAAINAKGVTIHSFFQMPFSPILPNSIESKSNVQRKFNKTKIDIIRSLDLVVIDEISMVRADLLDGIDEVLRRYKNRNKVFGGVQILMIGDLQQLSPVVKPDEWELLKSYYETVYFFSSKAFKESNAISIELKHIYRQDNQEFISILNEIRNDKLTPKSAEILNKRFNPNFIPPKNDGYITLTTHNNKANSINKLELDNLKSKSHYYTAEISGKFNEYSYPTFKKLELKVGAQVLFIKNDSSPEKRYFNGKIGTIIYLDDEQVTVKCPNDDFEIGTTRETWENISYTISSETKKIKENVIGNFSQIPLRLAWAITIHKSQGLTFEKAIIDAESSFAHGQTYVAISRCKSLEGIILKTPIRNSSIINDITVNSFTQNITENTPDKNVLNESQKIYQLNLIVDLFNYYSFLPPINRLIDLYYTHKNSLKGDIIEHLKVIKDNAIIPLLKVSTGFRNQLEKLSTDANKLENNSIIQERFIKAVSYFIEQTVVNIKKPLEKITFLTDNKTLKSDFEKQIQIIENQLSVKMYCLQTLSDGFSSTKYLEARAKAVLQKPKKKDKQYKDEVSNHPLLVNKLRLLRNNFAESEDVPHFHIFTQKTLYEMCNTLPTTIKQLLTVNGIGKIKVKKFGNKIIEIINDYCNTNKISHRENVLKIIKSGTKQTSLGLFKSGLTIAEIAKKRNFVTGTIMGHLSSFIETGEVDILELIPKSRFKKLKEIIQETKFENLSELKEKIDNTYTYNELRMMIIAMKLDKF